MPEERYISEDAPISAALTMKLQQLYAEMAEAPIEQWQDVKDRVIWSFFQEVIVAVHQLETGEPPRYDSEIDKNDIRIR
ncbi:MAG: hypothetical protein P0Y60_14410 [Candidatus Microbacterium colombiense]|nr:MAG: hypothetical protein P0Y60_14410 [Microbacterium sp.]